MDEQTPKTPARPRQKPGRPRLSAGDASVCVSLTLPATVYDAAYQRARLERLSLLDLVRSALQDRLREPDR